MSSSHKAYDKSKVKPEILNAWKIKLLVLLLCAISFFAGWQSHAHHSSNQCQAAGGEVIIIDDMTTCQLH